MDKVKAFWNSLPHQLQAVIVAFATGFLAAAGQALSDPTFALTLAQLKHDLPAFIAAGLASARVFYMLPSSNKATDKTTEGGKEVNSAHS